MSTASNYLGSASLAPGAYQYSGSPSDVASFYSKVTPGGVAPSSTGVLGASTTAADPATQALLGQYSQGINNTNSALGRLPGQEASSGSAIDASFNNALNQLLLSKNTGQQAYTTAKTGAATDYVNAKNTIGANAGTTLNGIQRLLGSRGAGGGSAATIGAPGIVARNATLQRGDASQTFGENNQGLDTNWNNFLTGYNNEVSSATNQRDQQKQALSNTIGNDRATLLNQLANFTAQQDVARGGNGVAASQPYLDQSNAILDSLANYTVAPINYSTSAYQAPSAASYSTTPQSIGSNAATTSDYTSPFLASLLGNKKQTANVGA